MKNPILFRVHAWRASAIFVVFVFALFAGFAHTAGAANWHSIEPLKSRRGDVERALGVPVEDKLGETGTLRFKVLGGMVTVSFVNARFVATKKLAPSLEGTVLQVVLQHERAQDTPESLGLINNSNFQREEREGVAHYRNLKDGIAYTFIGGKLKTTWYSPASERLARARSK
jgi:hypothetical protein